MAYSYGAACTEEDDAEFYIQKERERIRKIVNNEFVSNEDLERIIDDLKFKSRAMYILIGFIFILLFLNFQQHTDRIDRVDAVIDDCIRDVIDGLETFSLSVWEKRFVDTGWIKRDFWWCVSDKRNIENIDF